MATGLPRHRGTRYFIVEVGVFPRRLPELRKRGRVCMFVGRLTGCGLFVIVAQIIAAVGSLPRLQFHRSAVGVSRGTSSL